MTAAVPTPAKISIHAPLAGSDRSVRSCCRPVRDFNPRSPRGERHKRPGLCLCQLAISIHAPLAGSDEIYRHTGGGVQISIHAPLAGSDQRHYPDLVLRQGISIHAPLAGSDCISVWPCLPDSTFQSTLPSRGATAAYDAGKHNVYYFNPRSPRGERLGGGAYPPD